MILLLVIENINWRLTYTKYFIYMCNSLGLEDKFNLGIQCKSIQETRRLFSDLEEQISIPLYLNFDHVSQHMACAAAGTSSFDFHLNFYEHCRGTTAVVYHDQLMNYSRLVPQSHT